MFLEKIKERIFWSLRQVFSIRHFIGMALFIILFTSSYSGTPIKRLLMTVVFIVFCTYEKLGYAIVAGILIGIIGTVFPFLAIIIPLLVIVGIVKNLQFIWKNKYAVYLSIAVVMLPSGLFDSILGRFYDILTIPVTTILELLRSWNFIQEISFNIGINYEIVVTGVFFNLMMISLYLMKYSVKEAFTALGMVPLLILAFIIPAIMNEMAGAINAGAYDMANNQSFNPDPGLHDVNGYYRTNKYGQTEYIEPHIRTNPDGIEINNLSYKGKK